MINDTFIKIIIQNQKILLILLRIELLKIPLKIKKQIHFDAEKYR